MELFVSKIEEWLTQGAFGLFVAENRACPRLLRGQWQPLPYNEEHRIFGDKSGALIGIGDGCILSIGVGK
jgi:hypothetical protein